MIKNEVNGMEEEILEQEVQEEGYVPRPAWQVWGARVAVVLVVVLVAMYYITIACGGFYGPQGRQLRIPLADPDQNAKVESFEYEGMHITNFEMESSALAGLSKLLGHKATTCCMVIANRLIKEANTGYKSTIDNLIKEVLERV